MSERFISSAPATAKLSPAERDWIRRQARAARALAAEQHRWVRRAATSRPRVGSSSAPGAGR